MYTFAFFGSDEFSIIVLQELLKNNFIPTFCITQPDRPQGRKLVLTPTPLKKFCFENNIDVHTPENLELFFKDIKQDFDFFAVASYGKIISQAIIDIPKKGFLNVHPSLLPLYRGASPIETVILNNELETGVTIMLMDAKMDHGPILLQQKQVFSSWTESKKITHDMLAQLGGTLLTQTIKGYLTGQILPQEQNHSMATYTKIIKKSDGLIKLSDIDHKTYLKYLAFTPWPGLYFFVEKQNKQIRIKIESAHFNTQKGFVIDTVIPEGKKSMTFDSFKNGYLS